MEENKNPKEGNRNIFPTSQNFTNGTDYILESYHNTGVILVDYYNIRSMQKQNRVNPTNCNRYSSKTDESKSSRLGQHK